MSLRYISYDDALSLARYMARSAQRSSPALSEASVGAVAMPMLALMRTLTASRTNGSSSLAIETPGDRRGVLDVGVHDHHAELVAAHADEDVRAAQRARQPRAQLAEQLIAGRVAEGVVDLLEVVEVDEQEAEVARAAWSGRRRR